MGRRCSTNGEVVTSLIMQVVWCRGILELAVVS